MREDYRPNMGATLLQVVALEFVVGGPNVETKPGCPAVGGPGAGPIQQLGAQAAAGVGAGHGELVRVEGWLGSLGRSPQVGVCPTVNRDGGGRRSGIPDDEGF